MKVCEGAQSVYLRCGGSGRCPCPAESCRWASGPVVFIWSVPTPGSVSAPLSHPFLRHLPCYTSLCLSCHQGFSHVQLTKLRSLVLQLSWVISCKLTALVRPEVPDTLFRPHPVFLVQNLIDSLLPMKTENGLQPLFFPHVTTLESLPE